jgi:hypothetical protein
MKPAIRCWIVVAASLMPVAAVAQPAAGPPPITAVLATLTVKPGVDRTALQNTMPQEVSDTVKLYLDGKIQQWFARGDGRGVVFIMNAKSVDEAKTITDALPLIKANLATFEFMLLGPLTPLRILLTPPAAAPKGERDR